MEVPLPDIPESGWELKYCGKTPKSFYLEFFVNQNTGAGKNRGKYGLCENAKGLIVRESYNVLPTHGQNSSQKLKMLLLKTAFDKTKAWVFVCEKNFFLYQEVMIQYVCASENLWMPGK